MIGQYFGSAYGNWKLDGNANDSSGNGNNGTESNVTWIAGKFSGGCSFNGSTSRIHLQNLSSLKPSSFTVMAWYKGIQSSNGTIIENFCNATYHYGWFLGLLSGAPRLLVAKGTGTSPPHIDQVTSSVTVNNNSWHHVAATFDSGTLKIYVDGVLTGTKNWGYSIAYTSTQYPMIGVRLDAPASYTEYISGALDEVVVCPFLTDTQIRRWYSLSVGKL